MGVERARKLRKNMSAPEAKLWFALRQLRAQGHHVRRQVPIGPFYADFASHRAKLVIEVDGETHFGGGAELGDALRTERISADGYRVVRVLNSDVMANLEGVMDYLVRVLEERLAHSSAPPPERR
ncbi:MAG: DUF559 domain-containing protein [Devosia sp.]